MLMIIDEFNEEYGKEYKSYYMQGKEILKGTNATNKYKKLIAYRKLYCPTDALEYIHGLYRSGYGLKILGRYLNMSYTTMRCAFKKFNIPIRSGMSVSTEVTRKFRSEKALGDDNPWKNWPEHHPEWGSHSRRGISGYYIKNDGSTVWLRSAWEYIYAKWLDVNSIDWKYEDTTYQLSDNTTYRPDFFIYRDGVLDHIVEIKGYYDNRAYKYELLRDEYNLDVVLVTDISPYCSQSYHDELYEWKCTIRKNKQGIHENKKN